MGSPVSSGDDPPTASLGGPPLKVALVSDVHSNLPAFREVLAHLGRVDGKPKCTCHRATVAVDAVWCLGDTVGYNAHPRECLDLVREHASLVLLGNHDWAALHDNTEGFNAYAAAGVAYARQVLDKEHLGYLGKLAPLERVPPSAHGGGLGALLCHASPDDPLWEYVTEDDAQRYLRSGGLPAIVAFGHTHVPFILRGSDRLILNVGSVGQPRDHDPRAAFVVLDLATGDAAIHRVQYDIRAAATAVRDAGLPLALAERLYLGR